MNNLGHQGFQIFDELQKKPRAGWVREEVGIPLILCESVTEHYLNVERACKSIIIGDFQIIEDKGRFPDMGKYHDTLEYDMLDITPHCGISNEDKLKMELAVLSKVKIILGDEGSYIYSLIKEYVNQETHDSKLLTLLDKIDAGVKALEYEKLGFKNQVAQFHPYVLDKLNGNNELDNIYRILLEREFGNINYHFQYFTLLQLAGNYEKYREICINIRDNN